MEIPGETAGIPGESTGIPGETAGIPGETEILGRLWGYLGDS